MGKGVSGWEWYAELPFGGLLQGKWSESKMEACFQPSPSKPQHGSAETLPRMYVHKNGPNDTLNRAVHGVHRQSHTLNHVPAIPKSRCVMVMGSHLAKPTTHAHDNNSLPLNR